MLGNMPSMRFFIALILSALFTALPSDAATWYTKPTATGTGTGATAANAIAYTGVMAAASAGDTIIYCGSGFGSIVYTKNNLKLFSATLAGVTNKWSADVTGGPAEHGIYGAAGVTGVRIWGFKILSSYIDGIKFNGNDSQVRDCWIQKAGRGDPSWVTNSNGSFSGQGIAAHNLSDIYIENNLIENCGARLNQDHAIYVNGTNLFILSNIMRTNVAYGPQVYDGTGDNHNVWICNNLIHDNGQPGVSTSGLTVWTYGANKKVWILNNTIIARTGHSAGNINTGDASSRVYMTNNIIQYDTSYGGITGSGVGGTNSVLSGYNLKTTLAAGGPHGTGDTAGTATYDSEASARYCPDYLSPARNMALKTAGYSTDFYGRVQLQVYDVGAIQFEEVLASNDSRNWGDGARDPWIREPAGFTVTPTPDAHEIRFTDHNNQYASYEITRKDSVNNTYAVLASIPKGTYFYADPVSSMTNGVTYTYQCNPQTSLGNGGGINPVPVAVLCDKLSTIHPNRSLAWGTNITGLPNGVIPTNGWTVYDLSVSIPGTNIVAVGDGVTDNYQAIQAAINLSSSNSILYLPSGDYVVSATVGFTNQSLSVNNNKYLVGAGTNLTSISPAGGFSGSTVLQLGVFNEQGTERIVDAALAKGATQLTLPGGLGAIPIVKGTILKIWENPASGVFGGTGGNSDPVYNSNDGSTLITASAPLIRDTVVVTGISGNTLTFDPPLVNRYTSNARVQYQYLYMCNKSGIGGLTIDNTTPQISRIITWEGCAYSWITGVRTIKAAAAHIRAQMNTRWQMNGCLLYDATTFAANSGIGLQMLRDVDSGLCFNNVFSKLFPHVEYQKACDANFFAYNYYTEPQSGLAPVDNHGGHNTFNVHEGEDLYGYVMDGYFNGAQNWWFFRNFMHGNQPTFGARKILNMGRFTRSANIVWNVIGSTATNWQTDSYVSGYANSNAFIARWGYPNMGNDTHSGVGTTFQITDPSKVDIGAKSNAFLHGNFTHDTNLISYVSGFTNRTAPYSLFAQWNSTNAPSWFGASVWPSMGVDGGTVTTNSIPAKVFQTGVAPFVPALLSTNSILDRVYFYFFR